MDSAKKNDILLHNLAFQNWAQAILLFTKNRFYLSAKAIFLVYGTQYYCFNNDSR